MEQSLKIILLSFCSLMFSLVQTQEAGPLISRIEIRPGRFNQAQIAYASEAKSYVNGGVTFMYPQGIFKTAPVINVSIELTNLEYETDELVMALIVFNDASKTIVRVNRLPSGMEACTDDVIVHLHAIGR